MAGGFEQKLSTLRIVCGDNREPTGFPQRDLLFFHETEDLRVELERRVLVVYENACDVDSHHLIPFTFARAIVQRYASGAAYRDSGTCTYLLVSWSRGRPIRARRDAGRSPAATVPIRASSSIGCTARRASGHPGCAARRESPASPARRVPR